ncbi:MAG: electron transport complex protein RnfC [Desulfobacteraceae bacterium]|nr:electron transport complex protein RnfC [Desulfobacteraceae bacterium]
MKETIIEKVKQAGIVGAGGAGFPTHVKVNAKVDTVLVNGASCEPLLMSDPYLLEQEIDTVIKGLKAVLDATGATEGIICLKGKHAKAMEVVANAVKNDSDPRIKMFELEDFYPAGDEHVLVNEVMGRTVPEAGLPLNVGAVVSNVESLYNIALAMEDKPVTHRYLTVTGEIRNPMVVKVPVGSQVSEVLDFAGGSLIPGYRVVDGGPMMGRVLDTTDRPVTKTTSGLIVLSENHNVVAGKIRDPRVIRRISTTVCCQCSQCTDMCPRNLLGHNLHPHKLMRSYASDMVPVEARKEALLCSECGICEKFACPMGISPREVNAQIKRELAAEGIRPQSTGQEPVNNPFKATRHVPTKRLMQRLDVAQYDTHPPFSRTEFVPSHVTLLLGQHIGAPAMPVVAEGDSVTAGDLVAEIPEKALGARIHASITGVVTKVTKDAVTIKHQ